jgi:hypothetical protein
MLSFFAAGAAAVFVAPVSAGFAPLPPQAIAPAASAVIATSGAIRNRIRFSQEVRCIALT